MPRSVIEQIKQNIFLHIIDASGEICSTLRGEFSGIILWKYEFIRAWNKIKGHPLTVTINIVYVPNLICQPSLVLEKKNKMTFGYFALSYKGKRSTYDLYVHGVWFKVSLSLVNWFWKKRFLNRFTIFGHGCHFSQRTRNIGINLYSLCLWMVQNLV